MRYNKYLRRFLLWLPKKWLGKWLDGKRLDYLYPDDMIIKFK